MSVENEQMHHCIQIKQTNLLLKKNVQVKVSFERWLDKEDAVLIYNGILLSHKKRWNAAIYDKIDGPWEYYAKQNVRKI